MIETIELVTIILQKRELRNLPLICIRIEESIFSHGII